MYLFKIIVGFLLFQLVEVFGARDPPIVTIPDQGTLMGTYLKMFRTQIIIGYLGIPYAQPPTDERRFIPPVVDNLPKWEGIRNATQLPPDCMQNPKKPTKTNEAFMTLLALTTRSGANTGATTSGEDTPTKEFDEDCLFLNIFIPDAPSPADGYAVIAWLHSGDFSTGSPTELDPFQLVHKQKVIVVTIAYRLNIFGFMTSMDGESPGNFGLMDQSAALVWTKKNIKLFGGNENSITLMGHGSGATSAGLHLTSGEWTEELFHRVIIMSGNSLLDSAVREAATYSSSLDKTARDFGCFRRPTSKMLDCLRRVPAQLLSDGNPVSDWGPVIDEGLSNTTTPFIPDYPRLLVERGMLRKVPVLIGFTDMEEVLDLAVGDTMQDGMSHEMYETLLGDMVLNELSQFESNDSCSGNNQIILDAVNFVYKPYPATLDNAVLRKRFIDFNTERKYGAPTILLAHHMSKKTDVYAYRFDMKARTSAVVESVPEWVGVPHGFDLIFVWGLPYWVILPDQAQWDNTDKRITDIIMTLWMNFAKFGNPTQVGVYIKWDQFTADNPGILIVDRSFNMSDRSNMNYGAYQFWNDYYPKVVTFASQCCNATNSAISMQISLWSTGTIILMPKILFIYIKIIHFFVL